MAPMAKDDYCVRTGEEARTGGFWRDVFAELVATFFLVAAQLVLLQEWIPGFPPSPMQVGLGMAFVVGAVGYGLGDYGGAHMNPAVTMVFVVRAEISILKGVIYWIMQCAGAIAASYFVLAVTPLDIATKDDILVGSTRLADGVEIWQGVILELFITMIVCLAALGTSNIPRKGYIILPSIPVGLAVGLGLILALNSTGGSMNPARTLGPDVVTAVAGGEAWEQHWIYWVGPMGGGLLAAIFYWIFDSVDRPSAQVYSSNTWSYSNGQNGNPYNSKVK